MLDKDWTIKAEENEHGKCVHVLINESINIEDLMFSLLDDERHIIVNMKVTSREIYLCSNTDKPEFAKLGDCVKYVSGTGAETYKNVTK